MWTSAAGVRGTTINRVRLWLRGAGLDTLSARLRAGRAIEQVADSLTLPAGAILCVRRLRDPRPGHVSLSTLQAPPAVWAHAVGDALADLASRAARPAHGAVAPDAEAVIFDDRAQLLACLAADWCRGSIAACWWWRALIGASVDAEAVLRGWLTDPTHIAAAIEAVARLGLAAAFVARMTERETAMLLDAVVTTHALDSTVASIARTQTSAAASREIPCAAAVAGARAREGSHAGVVVPPPWREAAPEASALPLRADQQQLLGVALTVRRDPARARAAIFAEQVVEWRQAMAVREHMAPAAKHEAAPAHSAAAGADAAIDGDTPSRRNDVAQQGFALSSSVTTASRVSDHIRATVGAPLPSPSATDCPPASGDQINDLVHDEPLPPAISFTAVSSVDTDVGGIFYLLNVALALRLYGDFTAPRAPSLALSIWRFIAGVGEALLGARHRRDPVWKVLAELAGPDPLSLDNTPEWRLEPAWLNAFPGLRTWRWSADGDRTRVRHPAGFLIVDVPQSGERSPVQQVRDEVERYRAVCSFRLAKVKTPRPRTETPLARWTRWHTVYIRARLARALRVTASQVGPLLLRHRAHVRLSSTHVDVAFSLRDLPIAIRSSGLDRDPGWIPAADRIVSFRYD